MSLGEIKHFVLNWGSRNIYPDFGEAHMSTDISLLGMDSIDVVEFCEHLELKFGIEVDTDWVLEFETLNDLVDQVNVILEISSAVHNEVPTE
jgi:acyl carrier protein